MPAAETENVTLSANPWSISVCSHVTSNTPSLGYGLYLARDKIMLNSWG